MTRSGRRDGRRWLRRWALAGGLVALLPTAFLAALAPAAQVLSAEDDETTGSEKIDVSADDDATTESRRRFPRSSDLWVGLDEWEAEIGLRHEYHAERFGGKADSEDYRLRFFQEYLRAAVKGFLYDRRLARFNLAGELNVVQLRQRSSLVGKRSSTEVFGDYVAELSFLEDRPFSLLLGALQETALPNSAFDDRIAFVAERQYAHASWRNRLASIWARYERRVEESDYLDYRRRNVTERIEAHILRDLVPYRRTELIFEWEDTKQRTHQGMPEPLDNDFRWDVEIERTDFLAYDFRRFGLDRRHALNTDARYWRQVGTTRYDGQYARQRWVTDWTRRFRTHAQYLLETSGFENADTDSGSAEVGLRHQLYDSLVTRWDVYGRALESSNEGPDYDERLIGSRLGFDYGKTTPWGYLTAGYTFSAERETQELEDTLRYVVDEPVVMRAGVRSRLRKRDALPQHVHVTNIVRNITYVENLDYRVSHYGSGVYLERLQGGAIGEGQTVLVSYSYEKDMRETLDRVEHAVHIRHDWQDWLSAYARWWRADHDEPSFSSPGITESESALAGLRHRWRIFELSGEYERYDSDLEAYDLWRAELTASKQISRNSRAAASIQYNTQDFERSSQRSRDLLSAYATHTWRTPFGFLWDNQIGLEDDRDESDTSLLTVSSRARARYRQVGISMGVQYRERETFGSQRDTTRAFFEISRKLGGRRNRR